MIVDVIHDPDDLRAALTALLRQVGGKATIPGRDAAWAALGVKGRPRPQVRATRDAEPPYDVHLELVEDESVRVSAEEWQQLQAELGDATEVPGGGWKI